MAARHCWRGWPALMQGAAMVMGKTHWPPMTQQHRQPHGNSRFHSLPIETSVLGKPPVWRNGRRTGLKIFKIALSDRFSRLLLTRVSAFIYKAIMNFILISTHP